MSRKVPAFTDEQIKYLEDTFKEYVTYTADTNQLYVSMGQRQVIHHIKREMERIRQSVLK